MVMEVLISDKQTFDQRIGLNQKERERESEHASPSPVTVGERCYRQKEQPVQRIREDQDLWG